MKNVTFLIKQLANQLTIYDYVIMMFGAIILLLIIVLILTIKSYNKHQKIIDELNKDSKDKAGKEIDDKEDI